MTDIDTRTLEREMKKGSAELIILSIVESRARHGYEISKLIETRSQGQLKFHVASLYPLLYRLEERQWLQGRWVEKAGQRRRRGQLDQHRIVGAALQGPRTFVERGAMLHHERAIRRTPQVDRLG